MLTYAFRSTWLRRVYNRETRSVNLSVDYAPIAVTLLVGVIIGEAELRERGKEDNGSVKEYVPHDVYGIQEAFRRRM